MMFNYCKFKMITIIVCVFGIVLKTLKQLLETGILTKKKQRDLLENCKL